jgi:VRR-NUC domain
VRHEEDLEQAALMRWAALQQKVWPELKWLHHIPNGGHRTKTTAALLKALGVKPGVFDLFLPVPRHGMHGLYIEMKSKKGRMSPEQMEFGQEMANAGYAVYICRSFDQARHTIMSYLFEDTIPESPWVH